jgi:hypothetical protein
MMNDTTDPILQSRARVGRWVSWGLRVGYGLFALSLVLFVVALLTDFPAVLGALLTFCLIAGSIVLAPAIVFSYAVKAANRADREGTW